MGVLLLKHGTCLFLQYRSEFASYGFRQKAETRSDPHLAAGTVDALKQEHCSRVRFRNIPVYKIMVVFIQEAA